MGLFAAAKQLLLSFDFFGQSFWCQGFTWTEHKREVTYSKLTIESLEQGVKYVQS